MNTPHSPSQLQLVQLKKLHAAGSLTEAAYQEQCRTLGAADTPVEAAEAKLGVGVIAALLAVVALLALGGVQVMSHSSLPAVAAPAQANAAPHDPGSEQMVALVERLAQKMKDNPGDVEGWAMLARSYTVLGKPTQALAAYAQAMALRPDDARLMAGMEQARALAGLPGGAAALPAAPSPALVSGTLTLAPQLSQRVSPDDTVFILARGVQGDAAPLAVLRRQVKDLPLQFSLDDSTALHGRPAAATPIIVSARVSRSGSVEAQSGDLTGQAPATLGTSGLAIEIRELVK